MRLIPASLLFLMLAGPLGLAGCAVRQPGSPPPAVSDLASGEASADTADVPASPLLPSAFFADGADAFIAWRCTPAQDLIAAFPEDHLRLWSGQGHYRLDPAVVASGARYVKDDLSFWNKGDKALVESDNGRLECHEDVHRRTLTRADHPDSIFHAVGNEPGWTLDLDRRAARLHLVTEYGEKARTLSYQLLGLDNGEQARVTLRAHDNGEPITVRLRARACFDAMSGKPYPVRVRIETPERVLQGCGQGIERSP